MGLLVDGKWRDEWYDTASTGGRFVRQESGFRDWITADGSSGFKAEAGRYHLYVSLACPWASRVLILRRLRGLDNAISLSVVHPHMGENGWEFGDAPGCSPDPIFGADYLYQVYRKARPHYTGRVTVPALWDRERETIVNNESSELVRMLNSEFNAIAPNPEPDFYPPSLRVEIDAINAEVYDRVNNGVYKAGFATGQQPYEEAYVALFETLDKLDRRLADRRYLLGTQVTEADWRLFTTLVRFDAVYYGHFKCNRNRICDYDNLWPYLRDLYQYPGVAETVDFYHIKHHYYGSHKTINPTGIVPLGPQLDLDRPHDRARLSGVT